MSFVSNYMDGYYFAIDYLKECGGNVDAFNVNISLNQRLGQAFFNALSREDIDRLSGTPADPFHKTGPKCIYDAVEYLLDESEPS